MTNELTFKQIALIRRGVILGRTLQKNHPEIADMYLTNTFQQIIEKLDIESNYRINSRNLSYLSIHYAIAGHNGSFGIEAYEGLIPDEEERERIRREHNLESSREFCNKLYKDARGIHAQTLKEKRELGRKGAIVRGRTPWTDEEKEFVYQLSLDSRYHHPNGSFHHGEPNHELIKKKLNNDFHNGNEVRNSRSVNKMICKYKKSLESKID